MGGGPAVAATVGKQLRRADRLRISKDFRRVGSSGTRVASRHFIVLTAPCWVEKGAREETGPRLGLTVSRRVGRAVTRNRVKRRIREWFRQQKIPLGMQGDVLVIARSGAGNLSFAEITSELGAAVEALAQQEGSR